MTTKKESMKEYERASGAWSGVDWTRPCRKMIKKVCMENKEYTMGVKKVKETGKFEVVVKNEYGDVQDWDISQTEHNTRNDAEQSIFDWIGEYCEYK